MKSWKVLCGFAGGGALVALVAGAPLAGILVSALGAPIAVVALECLITDTLYEKHWPEMLVLEEGGEVAGLIQIVESEINGLWVRPDRQGTGVGTQLLFAGEDAIRRSGHAAAWLTCSAWNLRAFQYYLRRGYLETGRATYVHESGVEVEDISMERHLDPRGPSPGPSHQMTSPPEPAVVTSEADSR